MLYLAFTILVTIKTIYWIIVHLNNLKKDLIDELNIGLILTSLLWSIWYFYYLN